MELEESKPRMISVKSNELDKRSKFLFLAQVYPIRFKRIKVSEEWYRRVGFFTRINLSIVTQFEVTEALKYISLRTYSVSDLRESDSLLGGTS